MRILAAEPREVSGLFERDETIGFGCEVDGVDDELVALDRPEVLAAHRGKPRMATRTKHSLSVGRRPSNGAPSGTSASRHPSARDNTWSSRASWMSTIRRARASASG